MDVLTDPETVAEREGVEFLRETETVDPDDFADARADLASLGGWAVVGVRNDAGAVLFVDDGDHGWTLPAVAVDAGGDWVAAAADALEGVTGESIPIARPERVRRLDYEEDGGDGRLTVRHVVLRGSPVMGDPVADAPAAGCEDLVDAGWFPALPDGVEGVPADDARLFLG